MPRIPLLHRALAVSLLLLVAACGSGGGDSGSSSGGSTPDATPVAPGSSVSYASAPTLSGVAAVGAPLTRAAVTVVDGKGQALGSATTAVDGSYSLTLSAKTVTVPLVVQARGMDAAGIPQVLHSAVPSMSAASAAMVANVTPLSNAIVSLSLGADPAPVFAAASSSSASFTKLGNAAAAAATFLKTLVKTQLTDLKFSNAASLDLMGDGSFTANKSAQDLLVDSVRVSLGTNTTSGVAQLRLGNKLLPTLAQEVIVDLPTAQTELLKTGGTPANAITSILKATTSPTATLANLGSLDDLGAALNKLIAQAPGLATLTASPLLSVYDVNDGRGKSDLAAKLQDYSTKNWQFGRFQITGCADATVSGGLCNRVQVASPISDSTGTVVDLFTDAVSYNKSSTTGSKWNLIGNGHDIAIALYPVAVLAINADGTSASATSTTPNPGVGVQVEIRAQDAAAGKVLTTAIVQMPSGYSIPFAYCTQPLMCISATPGATLLVPTGGIGDTALLQAVAWIGSADSVAGAKYIASYTPDAATTAETRNVYLRADVLAKPANTRFPQLDGLSASAPLRSGEVLVGRTLNWSAWAAANPDMRLISLRSVLSDGQNAPLVTDTAVPLPPSTTLALPGLTLDAGFVPTSYEVWLGAEDSAGRRYYTRYTLTP